MKRFNFKKIIMSILVLSLVCYLKHSEISFDNYTQGVYQCIILWSENILINIIWLSPMLFTFYMLGKKYFYKLLEFDMRYKNRKCYFYKNVFNFIIESILFNIFVFFFQVIALLVISNQTFSLNLSIFTLLIQYTIEMTLAILIIVLTSLLFKSFIYAYLAYITVVLIGFIIIDPNKHLPFFNLYHSINISIISVIGIIVSLLLVKRTYNYYDIGGIES